MSDLNAPLRDAGTLVSLGRDGADRWGERDRKNVPKETGYEFQIIRDEHGQIDRVIVRPL